MNEAKLLNNLPLNGDLKPLSIGDENSPIELSKTKVRIQNLDVIGDFNIDGQDDNLLDRTGTNTYLKNTGDNFGIGTTSPSQPLHIVSSGNGGLEIDNSSGAPTIIFDIPSNEQARLYFQEDDTVLGSIIYETSGTPDAIAFKAGSNAERMRITDTGNVGIGTTSPSYKLTVEGQSEFENSSTDDVIFAKVTTDSVHKFSINTSGQMQWGDGSNPRDTNLYRDSANKLRTADTFIVDGSVGIGITAPDESLHIVGKLWVDHDGTNDGLKFTPGATSTKASIQALENTSSAKPLELQATSFDFWGASVRLLYLDTNSNISLSNNDDGTSNTVFGYQAGHLIGSGDNYNVFIGHQVADADMTNATNNVGIGYQALSALTEGDRNIVIGYQAGLAITNNLDNVVIGNEAFKSADAGQSQNVVIGKNAGDLINTATQTDNNVIIGMEAGRGGSGAVKQCVVIGRDAMKSTGSNAQTGTIAIGMEALTALSSGARNTAIGYQSQIATTTGENNTAVGYESLYTNIDGDKNTAIGYRALYSMEADTDGHGWNTAVGNQAGNDVSSGVLNSIFGHDAGNTGSNDLTTGDANTLLGAQSAVSSSGAANQTAVGYGATGQADNSVTLGNANVTKVYMAQDSGATVYCGDINVQYHYIRAGINYDQSAGTFVVIPLDGGTRPFTTFAGGGEKLTMIAPHNGSLETVYIRSEEVAGNPVVVGFHKATTGTEVPSDTPTSSISTDMSGVADDTSTKFTFTLNNTFSAGDVLGFSIDPANDINDCSFMIVLKFDTTT